MGCKTQGNPGKRQRVPEPVGYRSDSRVPSKRVAMVSRNVFCGARSPRMAGILGGPGRPPHASGARGLRVGEGSPARPPLAGPRAP